mgnify:CR=1 FL=1
MKKYVENMKPYDLRLGKLNLALYIASGTWNIAELSSILSRIAKFEGPVNNFLFSHVEKAHYYKATVFKWRSHTHKYQEIDI